MSIKNIFQKKAAFYFAAFFIIQSAAASVKLAKNPFEEIKKNASLLLIKKQKTEAIQLVSNFIKTEQNKNVSNEAADFIEKLSQTFMSKEAQDAYEGSLNATLENVKESKKLNESCLQLEPENLDCLIQKMRLAYREKDSSTVEKTLQKMNAFAHNTKTFFWVNLFVLKNADSTLFKDKTILKRFGEAPSEESFILATLEVERCFLAKNFSRAKSGLEFLEKYYPDDPESIYFKQKLDLESIEGKTTNQNDANVMYITKCKSLTKSMARKFRYDFELCQRGQP